jgi:ornithine--oxo-acid transaminase
MTDDLTSAQHIALTEQRAAHNYHPLPVVLAHGEGAWVTDVEGRRYLDCLAGYSALNFGHRHPRLVARAEHQLGRLTLTSRAFYNDQLGLFAEALGALVAKDTILPMNSGAEAVETALKVARKWGTEVKGVAPAQGRIVVMEGNFHGRTTTIVSFSTDERARAGFGPYTPGFDLVPYGDAAGVEAAVTDETVAVLLEPIQGEGGVVIPPPGFVRQVRELCDRHGILLIADEIQAGFGRTGKLFAIEHSGVVPDLVTTAKSLAAGMPLAAVTGRAEVMDAPHPGGLGGTYSGNPLACVAAREAIDTIRRPEFLARATEVGERIRGHLEQIQAEHPDLVGDVRGLGAMLVMELVTDAESKGPDIVATVAVTAATLERGVITIRAGLFSNCVRFLPPLTITDEEIDEAMAVVAEAVRVAAKERVHG